MITGKTRLVGVMGWPVSHSRSPAMQNAAFAALGLDWVYLPLPVPPGEVEKALTGLHALGFVGANVTIPHKQAVLPFLDELTPNARATGAANTIVVRPDGSLLGDNTDVPGFLADLAPLLPDLHPDGKYRPHPWRANAVPFLRAIVLGAGGAARAVTYALLQVGARVRIVNRTNARRLELRRAMEQALPDLHEDSIGVMGWDQLPQLAHWADLIVNCTSLGLAADDNLPWDRSVPFLPGQIVYDTIYNRPTELLGFARSCGAIGINGLGMLVHQGARSFELWTERRAPVDVMARAVERWT